MVNSAPIVSVVIPTYNRADALARCLRSLCDQTLRDFEVLVCDDGSTDHTPEVLTRYQHRMDLIHSRSDNFGGPARPRNAGLALARGRYIAFLDSDDWWFPRKLELSVRALEAGCDVAYHPLKVVEGPNLRPVRTDATRYLRPPVFRDLLVNGNALSNSSVVTRRELMVRIGGFSEDRRLIAVEDYDAWLRLARVTERFMMIPVPLGFYWNGGGNISNPRRTIDTISALEERYASELAESGGAAWMQYVLAQAYAKERGVAPALAELGRYRGSNAMWSMRVRIFALRLILVARVLFKIRTRGSRQ